MSYIHAPKPLMRTVPLLLLLVACEKTTTLGENRHPDGGSDADGIEEDTGVEAGAPIGTTDAGSVFALCPDGLPCECSNGEDDDGDGRADGFDGECTGPFDDDERTFAVNDVPQGNKRCSDCFYDGNPGRDDGCGVATQCMVDGTFTSAPGNCRTCDAAPVCETRCLPITPNGCDCFGCCEVWSGGTSVQVQLVKSCSIASIGRPELCPRCQINPSCNNPCERCELCPGKTEADLPSDCRGAYSCGDRETCSMSVDCIGAASGEYCGQGCCVPIVY